MDNKLKQLFDFQHFQCHQRLNEILDDVEARYVNALSDDDLDMVSAAGDAVWLSKVLEDKNDDQ